MREAWDEGGERQAQRSLDRAVRALSALLSVSPNTENPLLPTSSPVTLLLLESPKLPPNISQTTVTDRGAASKIIRRNNPPGRDKKKHKAL